MYIGDKYRFKLSIPTLGIVDVFPVNETLTWTYKKSDDLDSFVLELSDDLTFVDDTTKFIGPLQPRQDFTYIYSVERQRLRCDRIQIFIEKRCDTSSPFVPYWNGFFTMRDCSFDVEKCRVDVKVKQDIPENCLLDEWDRETNFLITDTIVNDTGYQGYYNDTVNPCTFTYTHPIGYYTFPAQIEVGNCLGVAGLPSTEGWIELSIIGTYNGDGTWTIVTKWVREELNQPTSPGPGWISLGGNLWVRQPQLQLVQEQFFSASFSIVRAPIYTPGGYTNGRLLTELLPALFEVACPGSIIISNFFNINPDGSNPTNSYYADAAIYLDNVGMFPVHDQAKTDETAASFRIDQWTLEDLITDLINTFNLKLIWTGTQYYLEHVSYGSLVSGLDLTQPEGLKYISGKWKYSYDRSKLFKKESWSWPINVTTHSVNRNDYFAVPIRYSSVCLDENSAERTTSIQIFLADFTDVVGNESLVGSHMFLIVGLDSANKIRIDNGYFSVSPRLNGRMGFPWLHQMFWKYGRPLPSGEMNFAQQQFEGVEKIRNQEPISLDMCCLDWDTNFDPSAVVRTQMGDGELIEAVYEEPAERLTLTLKHA